MQKGPVTGITMVNLPWKSWTALLAGGAVLAAVVLLGVFWLRHQITTTNYTVDTTPMQVIIGDDVLNIPANLIRFRQQRKTMTPEQIDLAVVWPSGAGYSQSTKQQFLLAGPQQKLIFIKLRKRAMAFDMSARLDPIYKALFEGEPVAGPSGLVLQPLQQNSAYGGENLAIYHGAQGNWVARCHLAGSSQNPTCLRDINMGRQLNVTYRFPLALLNEWNKIEHLVFDKVHSLIEQ